MESSWPGRAEPDITPSGASGAHFFSIADSCDAVGPGPTRRPSDLSRPNSALTTMMPRLRQSTPPGHHVEGPRASSPAVIARRKPHWEAAPGEKVKRSESASELRTAMVGLNKSRQQKSLGGRPISVDTSYHSPFEVAYHRIAKQRNLRRLADLFVEADTDGSMELSMDEFREALRKPRIQRIFSTLGIQPHQSELVFKSMCQHKDPGAELSIQEFIQGLTSIVGTDVDGTGQEINVSMLRPTRKATQQRAVLAKEAMSDGPNSSPPEVEKTPKPESSSEHYLGQVNKLPLSAIHRAFLASASAQALHPATAVARKIHKSPSSNLPGKWRPSHGRSMP